MKDQTAIAGALFDAGWEAVEAGNLDQAQKIGQRLARIRFSGAFEILALVQGRKGEFGRACKILESGVKRVPKVWRLWQLLGNYRSEQERYGEAFKAYRSALNCPNVDNASVHLNWAVALNRAGRPKRALQRLAHVRSKRLKLRCGCEKVAALMAGKAYRRAAQVGATLIRAKASDEIESKALAAIHANLAECRRKLGQGKQAALSHAWKAIRLDQTQGHARFLIREIRDLRSTKSGYWRIMVCGVWPWRLDETSKTFEFMMPLEVVADSRDEGLKFATEFERPEVRTSLRLESAKRMELRPREPKGVYWVGGRCFYPTRRHSLG